MSCEWRGFQTAAQPGTTGGGQAGEGGVGVSAIQVPSGRDPGTVNSTVGTSQQQTDARAALQASPPLWVGLAALQPGTTCGCHCLEQWQACTAVVMVTAAASAFTSAAPTCSTATPFLGDAAVTVTPSVQWLLAPLQLTRCQRSTATFIVACPGLQRKGRP